MIANCHRSPHDGMCLARSSIGLVGSSRLEYVELQERGGQLRAVCLQWQWHTLRQHKNASVASEHPRSFPLLGGFFQIIYDVTDRHCYPERRIAFILIIREGPIILRDVQSSVTRAFFDDFQPHVGQDDVIAFGISK